MTLTYLIWGYEHDEAIMRAFREMGLEIQTLELGGEETLQSLQNATGDIVFSVNFLAEVSDFCCRRGIPYCSWVLQLPNFDLYMESVKNICNYIGICDSYLVEKMWSIGVEKAFFLPDAVDTVDTQAVVPKYREVCFVGTQPENRLQTEGMSLYSQGYLDSFLHSQRVLLGSYILENGLLSRVQQETSAANPVEENILPELRKLYLADRYLAPACTFLQQNIFLQNYESVMTIYSNGDFANCKCDKLPFLEDVKLRTQLYREKEFTVVLAPHTLHNAIPRQALEVIAAGGFPLCAMQKDYSYFFKEQENIACFHTASEFQDMLVRYGNDAETRARLREKAVKIVQQQHTYRNRISSMLDMWVKL